MKRWFRIIVISLFALAAVSLVVLQYVQTRRTFTISDNMFSIGVGNAMDEVIGQLGGEVLPAGRTAASTLSYHELDSLITEELLVNGIDMHPVVGLYDGNQGTFLYSSDPRKEDLLEGSPYRYSFQPIGVISANRYYIILGFPRPLLPQHSTSLYVYMTLFLILIIAVLFIISLRTIASQRRLDQMKTEFINNMTHEIKTPISTISLACEMLRDDSISHVPEQRNNFLAIISDENNRMKLLVETLLQSAKMSNKSFGINLRSVDMNEVVAAVAHSFDLAVSNRQGRLSLALGAVPSVVPADELHITNMVYNLIDNAIKYSSGAPDIVLSTAAQECMFELRVQDHGIGISREDQKHIFEKFYRVSTGNVHNVKGFGIGLNYVAEVVRLHHGRIAVESEPGQGSTFTVSLPMQA